MLEVLGSVLNVLTFAVGALGGISLVVGGIGILTIMTIAVNERRSEIGLLRALGARQYQILNLFLGEALVLSAVGGLLGLLLGAGGAQALHAGRITANAYPPCGDDVHAWCKERDIVYHGITREQGMWVIRIEKPATP